MMTCKEVIDFLSGYVDGEIPPAERAAFEKHLAVCPSCRAYLESFKQTIALARGAYSGPATATQDAIALPESLVRAVLAARNGGDAGRNADKHERQ